MLVVYYFFCSLDAQKVGFATEKVVFFRGIEKKNGYNRYSSVCVLGQLTRKSFSVARVKAV